ncbi:MAG: DUF4340 domain-containing protein [Candidatus Kuenenia sp.]|nr:DUF4340 domain-containing protein [Candidatus Kuenenia hertensis]
MKFKTTIILLIIAIVGITYIFVYEKKQLPQEEWERLQKKVLPYFKSSLVNKIELKNETGKIVLEKADNDYWFIVEPFKLRANNSEVSSILSEFEFMTKVGSFEKEDDKPFDLKDYGLEDQENFITMYTSIKTSPDKIQVTGPKDKYTVFIGNKLAAGDNVYIKLDTSDEVVVVPGSLIEKVNKSLLDLRSKWVFTFDKEAVSQLQIKTNESDIVCVREGEFWRMTEPLDDLADLQKIKDIIAKLKNLEINREDFLPEGENDLSKFGLDDPSYTVTVTERGHTQSVIFGYLLDDKVYAKRVDEQSIFLLKDIILAEIKKKPNDLRDRALVRFDSYGSYGVNKLEFKTRSDLISIEKSLDLDWVIRKPIDIYADQDTTKNFIEKIKTLEIVDFVTDKPDDLSIYGLENPVFEVSVTKEENKELAKFYVGKKLSDGNKCYVKRVGEEPVYTVPTVEFYDKLENALIAFRDRLVCDFDKNLVKKIVIEKADRTFLCEKTNKTDEEGNAIWELSKPVQGYADSNKLNQIVWNLSFLKAENHVMENPKDLKEFGLDNPRMKIHVTYEKVIKEVTENGGDQPAQEKQSPPTDSNENINKIIETRTLLIGNTVTESEMVNSYAMFSDGDLVFELSWPKIRDFNAELVPTKVLDFERMNVRKLTLVYPGRNIEFERSNNFWELKNYDQKDFQSREVDYYIHSLEKLVAEYIEQYKATNLTQFSLDEPQLAIIVELGDGEEVLYIGKKKDENSYYAKSKDSEFIYVLSKSAVEKVMKKEEDFTIQAAEKKFKEAMDILNTTKEHIPADGSMHGKPQGHSPHGGFH